MDPALLMLPLILVAFGAGILAGMVLQRRALRRGEVQAEPGRPETLKALDAVVADSMRWLARWVKPTKDSEGDEPRTLTLAPDGTITLLFSDIARSTRLNRRLGDGQFTALLRAHDDVVREIVAEHDGHVVKTQGDGFMAAFHDPAQAVRAALTFRDLVAEEDRLGHALTVRIGLHTGQAVTDAGDVFGESVAFAARVAGNARSGEVLVSEALRRRVEATAPDLRFTARLLLTHLKDLPGLHQLHRAAFVEQRAAA
jgi:adenylate cyclase